MLLFTGSRGQHEQTLASSPDNTDVLIWFVERGDGSSGLDEGYDLRV